MAEPSINQAKGWLEQLEAIQATFNKAVADSSGIIDGMVRIARREVSRIEILRPDDESSPSELAKALIEMRDDIRAIRALLERQTSLMSWRSGLQRDPFSPSIADPEQAAQEAHSTALAARSTASGLDLARVDSPSPSGRTL